MHGHAVSLLPYNAHVAINFADADANLDENCEILIFCTIL